MIVQDDHSIVFYTILKSQSNLAKIKNVKYYGQPELFPLTIFDDWVQKLLGLMMSIFPLTSLALITTN